MKIFPSTHKIKSITESHVDLDLNVPLAYIELDYSKYKIDKVMEDIANTDVKTEVLVNQEFSSPSVKLFNKFNEAVNMDNLLTRVGDKYYHPSTIEKEKLVIYTALYGDRLTYVRPLPMFLSKVDKEKYPNATHKFRLERI